MAGFLDEYGVAEEKRNRVILRLVIACAVIVIGTIAGYFILRTYPAKRQVNTFLDDLRKKDFPAAYRAWGCSKGCPDYPYNRFLEDWGPSGKYASSPVATIRRSRYCDTGGTIVVLSSDVYLWYERNAGTIGYAPWRGACDPHVPAPVSAP